MDAPLDPAWPFISLLADASEYFYCFRDFWDPTSYEITMTWKDASGECYRFRAVLDERAIKKKIDVTYEIYGQSSI